MTWVTSAIVGGSVVSGYMGSQAAKSASGASTESTRLSTEEQRRQFDLQREDTAPYREAGVNALNELEGAGRYGEALPQYGGSGTAPPEFGGGDRFQYNLEGDKGYQFARDEGIRATNREMAGGGKYGSGNRLAAIADRVTGIASQYANDAYNRQMGQSQTNYGRDVSEYNINKQRESDLYGRGLTDFGLDYQRAGDQYGREQNYLNRLSSMAGIGQTATAQSGAAGSNMANAIGNINLANAANQTGAANTMYGSANNAIQGGISNMMLYQNMQPGNVAGDAYQPAQNYYGG